MATQVQGSMVVTGASTGIGEACALALDRAGYRVFAGVRRPADGERIKAKGGANLEPVLIDVTNETSVASAAKVIEEKIGKDGLAGLVNNAGIAVAGPLEFLPLSDLRRQLEVNVLGQMAVTQAMLPMLRKATGRIAFISSTSGFLSTPYLGPYCASKFAIEALADALRMELAPWGIRISLIQPGAIATPIWDKSTKTADDILKALPPKGHELYDNAIEAVKKASEKMSGRASPVSVVSDAVVHALTAKKPRTRYLIGANGSVERILARWAPDRLRDKLIIKEMGLDKASY